MDLTAYFDRYARDYRPYKGGSWCYEDGCVYRGLECLHRATGEDRWRDHLVRLVSAQVGADGALAGYDPAAYNIDNIQPGRALLYLDRIDGDPRWMAAAARLAAQLAGHPRTRSGVYWHKLRYPSQVWLDGLYMGAPFQVGYGLRVGDDALVDDALTQIATALRMTRAPGTGLYVHATDEARAQPWADPETGRSAAHWARAMGWLAMALVDVAAMVGEGRFAPLRPAAAELMARLADLRRPGGLWLQVIDRPDLPGNYVEASASAMFTYALLRGRRLGLCDGTGEALFPTLAAGVMRPGPDGPEMADICEVAGLGAYEGRHRDGSPGYYLTEARVADDAKGVGPLMMAFSEEAMRAKGASVRPSVAAPARG